MANQFAAVRYGYVLCGTSWINEVPGEPLVAALLLLRKGEEPFGHEPECIQTLTKGANANM